MMIGRKCIRLTETHALIHLWPLKKKSPMYACILYQVTQMLTKARLKDCGILWQAYIPARTLFPPSIFSFPFFLPLSLRQQSSRSLFQEYRISRWPQYSSKDSRIFSCSSIPSPLLWNTDIVPGTLRPRSALLGYKVWHHVPLGRLVWTRLMESSAKEDCLTVYILSYQSPGAVLSTEITVSSEARFLVV